MISLFVLVDSDLNRALTWLSRARRGGLRAPLLDRGRQFWSSLFGSALLTYQARVARSTNGFGCLIRAYRKEEYLEQCLDEAEIFLNPSLSSTFVGSKCYRRPDRLPQDLEPPGLLSKFGTSATLRIALL